MIFTDVTNLPEFNRIPIAKRQSVVNSVLLGTLLSRWGLVSVLVAALLFYWITYASPALEPLVVTFLCIVAAGIAGHIYTRGVLAMAPNLIAKALGETQ